MKGEIARLDSESYVERTDAQLHLERIGNEALAAVRDAVGSARLGWRGRLHAIWTLAHIGGPAAIDELIGLVRSDTDERVQAQAMRALADLADPVLVRHRLASGPGDAKLAARMAALASGRGQRVVLELTIALGRLRWPGASAWLRATLKHPDPTLGHAAVQTLRRSENWPAVLALLDEPDTDPIRILALRAVAGRTEPVVVDGLIARLGTEGNPERRRQYAEALRVSSRSPDRGPTGDTGRLLARQTPSPGNEPRQSLKRSIACSPTLPQRFAWRCCVGCGGKRSQRDSRPSVGGCVTNPGQNPWPRSWMRWVTTPPTRVVGSWPR